MYCLLRARIDRNKTTDRQRNVEQDADYACLRELCIVHGDCHSRPHGR
jgi:hypothetical protein